MKKVIIFILFFKRKKKKTPKKLSEEKLKSLQKQRGSTPVQIDKDGNLIVGNKKVEIT